MKLSKAARREIRRVAKLIAPLFKDKGWEWSTVAGVPDEFDLEDHLVRDVCAVLARPDCQYFSSGRLRVIRESYTDGGEVVLTLELGRIYLDEVDE